MADITCCIMNNLVGLDFINVHRLYDLKGSTFGRRTKLSEKEKETGNSGMKVLKDLNFIDEGESM